MTNDLTVLTCSVVMELGWILETKNGCTLEFFIM